MAESDASRDDPATFPLRLTPFERYMLVDERPGYPMTFVMEFLFAGKVDRLRWEQAAQTALRRHPLLTARLTSRGRHGCWEGSTAPSPAVVWTDSAALNAAVGTAIDPTAEHPFRLRASQDGDRMILQAVFHHAVTDGLGALGFVGDLWAEYEQLRTTALPEDSSELRSADARLASRGQFDVELPEQVSRWETARFLARETARFFLRPLVKLETQRAAPEGVAHPLLSIRLPDALVQALEAHAQRAVCSLNDIVLAALFESVAECVRRCPSGSRNPWIRIAVPVSLRGRKDRRLSAANKIGYAFLDRRLNDCSTSPTMAQDVSAEIALVRRWSMAVCFVDAVRLLDRLPGALYAVTRRSENSATTVCSYLGNLDRLIRPRGLLADDGSLILRECAAAPPVRPGVGASLGVVRVGQCVRVAIARDPQRFAASAAVDLLRTLATCLARASGAVVDSASMEVCVGLAHATD